MRAIIDPSDLFRLMSYLLLSFFFPSALGDLFLPLFLCLPFDVLRPQMKVRPESTDVAHFFFLHCVLGVEDCVLFCVSLFSQAVSVCLVESIEVRGLALDESNTGEKYSSSRISCLVFFVVKGHEHSLQWSWHKKGSRRRERERERDVMKKAGGSVRSDRG